MGLQRLESSLHRIYRAILPERDEPALRLVPASARVRGNPDVESPTVPSKSLDRGDAMRRPDTNRVAKTHGIGSSLLCKRLSTTMEMHKNPRWTGIVRLRT